MSKTKQKHTPAQQIKPTHFMAGWLFASVAVWPAVVIVGTALGMISSLMLSTLSLTPFAFLLEIFVAIGRVVPFLYFMILVGVCIGLSVGILQKAVMRHYLGANVERWILYSVLGGITGTGMMIAVTFVSPCMGLSGCLTTIDPNLTVNADLLGNLGSRYALILALVLTGLSMVQWVWLRKQVGDAWLWVLANATGGLTFMMLMWNQTPDLLGAIFFAGCLGAITGMTLLWLFQNRRIVDSDALVPTTV